MTARLAVGFRIQPCGYFGRQPLTALGRFLGQGLIITTPTNIDCWDDSDNQNLNAVRIIFNESSLGGASDEDYDNRPLYAIIEDEPLPQTESENNE